jgi:hypothetical protein
MPARSRGITAGRSWVHAPTPDILRERWSRFIAANTSRRREMFHETKRYNIDRTHSPLPGFPEAPLSLSDENGSCPEPVPVAYRAFDRQWLIPDKRLLAESRTGLWRVRGNHQIFISQQDSQEVQSGPAVLFSAFIPDSDYFSGWGGGGVHPLWRGANDHNPNLAPGLLPFLSARLGMKVSPLDFAAYLAAVTAHPGFTARFRDELVEPQVRVPLSTDPTLWRSAITLGQQLIWLHTYGTRFSDPAAGRNEGELSIIEKYGVRYERAISALPDRLPEQLEFDAATGNLSVGQGVLGPVAQRVVEYDVAGRRILWRWLNDRTTNPWHQGHTCPELDYINVKTWNHRLDRELLALLSVLNGCVSVESAQGDLLSQVCEAPTFTVDDLRRASVNLEPPKYLKSLPSGESVNVPLFGA